MILIISSLSFIVVVVYIEVEVVVVVDVGMVSFVPWDKTKLFIDIKIIHNKLIL